jgi:uncharacterized membrane protein HdeD (DUF308 family)
MASRNPVPFGTKEARPGDDAFAAPAAPDAASPSAALARNWALVLIRGLLGIALGVAAFLLPTVTLASLVLLFAAYMLVDGVVAIASGLRRARRHQRWAWFIVEGCVDLAAAGVAFVWPTGTVLVFVLLVAAWALASGVLMLIAAIRLSMSHGRGWLVLAGAVSLGWGILLMVSPAVGAIAMTWWLGAYALSFGIAMVALAWRLRRAQRHGAPHDPEPVAA